MPELPEVEACRQKLLPLIRSKTVLKAKASQKNYAFLDAPQKLCRALKGQTLEDIDRRGKYLLFKFKAVNSSFYEVLLIHLGMTGQLFSYDYKPDQHVHLTLNFSEAPFPLYFRDVRKFGKLALFAEQDLETNQRIAKLGPDALEMELERLRDFSKRHKTLSIKGLLLDQSVYAGVGNIYADESLFMAGIHPAAKARTLSTQRLKNLAQVVPKVLKQAIKQGGSSINDYILPDGSPGYFQREHQVYGRGGQECFRCKTSIQRTTVAQRGTHHCPNCQKK